MARRVLVLLFILAGCVAAPTVLEKDSVFERVCQDLAVDCTEVQEPEIVYTKLIYDLPCSGCRYRGLVYNNEPYIFISSMEPLLQQAMTVYHEMVHYVSSRTDRYDGYCENEELARVLTAIEFELEYDDKWKIGYGCTE